MGASSTDEARALIWSRILRIARHLGKRNPLPVEPGPLLVQLRKGAADTPVYFIGMGLAELQLAELICADNSFFAIEVPWPSAWRVAAVQNRPSALPTMEQLVAPYVSALSAHARLSPCVLAGASFCGLMAFEAAHQFNRRGGKVELVMLLDSRAKYPSPHQVAWEKLKKDWKPLANSHETDGTARMLSSRIVSFWFLCRWMLVRELKLLWHRFKQAVLGDLGSLTAKWDDLGMPLHWAWVERIYSYVVKDYRLQCLDCRGVLFRADSKEDKPARDLDGSLGWENLFSKGLEIIQMTGDHVTMMQKPHSIALAREMSKVLSR
jgi:thioesterase domain-containing protein